MMICTRTRALPAVMSVMFACTTTINLTFTSDTASGDAEPTTITTTDASSASPTTTADPTAPTVSSSATGAGTSDGVDTAGSTGGSTVGDSSTGIAPTDCGNGVVEMGEECDDGNQKTLDGCDPACTATKIDRVLAGNDRTCVLIEGGYLQCWGINQGGTLGYGHTDHIGDNEPASAAGIIDVGGKVLKVGMGFRHTCVLLEGGSVRCWGQDRSGSLGTGKTGGKICLNGQQYDCAAAPACCIGDDELPSAAPPVDVGGKAIDLAAGSEHTCVVLESGTVRCWGYGFLGALGLGTTEDVGDNEVPSAMGPVSVGGTATRLYAGAYNTCARLNTGEVRCWGKNGSCELGLGIGFVDNDIGDNELPSSQAPVPIGGPELFLAPRSFHTCALLEGSHVKCWGNAGYLGNGDKTYLGCIPGDMPVPDVDVGGMVVEIATGAEAHHNCARLDDGTVRCWGPGVAGDLGYGNVQDIGDGPGEMPPAPVMIGGTAASVSVGLSHTCVALTNQEVRCWGTNPFGQLGYGHQKTLGDEPGEMPPPAVPLFE